MKKEIWKLVVGFEDRYEVSNLGRIRSKDCLVKRKDGRSHKKKGKILNPSLDARGYRYIKISERSWDRSSRKNHRIHRLIMISFYGANDMQVDHINGDKGDNRLSNLQYVTARENALRGRCKDFEMRYLAHDKKKNFWSFYIFKEGKQRYICGSINLEKVKKARDKYLEDNPEYSFRKEIIF